MNRLAEPTNTLVNNDKNTKHELLYVIPQTTIVSEVIYTYTSTSYSYIPTTSIINGSDTSSSSLSTNNIILIASIIGGAFFLFLIGIGTYIYLRYRKKKRYHHTTPPSINGYEDDEVLKSNGKNDDDIDSPIDKSYISSNRPMSTPRHLVAPLQGFPSTNTSMVFSSTEFSTTATLSSINKYNNNNNEERHVPNEYESHNTTTLSLSNSNERHVPHLID